MVRACVLTILAAVIAVACGGRSSGCAPVALASGVEEQLSEAREAVDFEPVPPCSFRSGFSVRRVFIDSLPGEPPRPRINFSVARSNDRVFTLSETRALLPFRAIPQGTHTLRTTRSGVVASGFAGPSGSGDELAYLRWRIAGVTYELSGTLGVWLTEVDVKMVAEALIAQTSGQQ